MNEIARAPTFHDLRGKVAVVTGGGGAICSMIARALAAQGVSTAIWDISEEAAGAAAEKISAAGGRAIAVACDVLEKPLVQLAAKKTLEAYGTVDILINGAGGSRKEATTSPRLSFFDIDQAELSETLALNCQSAVLTSQVVGRVFAEKGKGAILNIASIAGIRPLTRAVAYCGGKAALINFTQWLAVHIAKEYSTTIRVNALAPGFVLTDQNRFLLVAQDTGRPTKRGEQIMESVPMGRYGKPEEMVAAALWLVSDHASFVTGAVIPIDGGFSAFSGV